MVTYYWELGIDWNGIINTTGTTYMPCGFYAPASGGAAAFQRPVVGINDGIVFNLFDITTAPSPISTTQSLNLTVSMLSADTGQSFAPPSSYTFPSIAYQAPQYSMYFGQGQLKFPCWSPVTSRTVSAGARRPQTSSATTRRNWAAASFCASRSISPLAARAGAQSPRLAR